VNNQRPGKRPVVRVFWTSSPPKDYRKRLAYALALSLSIHVLILSMQFGAFGLGLPGLAMPWEVRRMQASELNVRLVEAPRPPPPAPAAEPLRLALTPQLSLETPPKPAKPPRAEGSFEVQVAQAKPPPPLSEPVRAARKPAPAAKARARDRKIRPKPQPQILAQTDPQEETFNVPPPRRAEPERQRAPERAAKKQTEAPRPEVQAAAEEAARKQAAEAARLEAEQAARRQAAEEEAARLMAEEAARQRALALQKELETAKQAQARRLEVQKQEEAQRLALELEARALAEEAARQEAGKLALQRALELEKEQEAKKEEEARRLALEAEALKRAEDAAREQAIARQKELEAQRLAKEAAERAKEAAERKRAEAEAAAGRERDRLAAQKAPAPAPGALSGKDLAAKALEQLRTPGAARDDVLRPPSPPLRAESPRRRSLFGVERDVGLRMYVESWRWKIERNGALNYRPSAGFSARDNPVVTVSIRSDGSLEDVAIHRSSGVWELDEAVRRIARLNAPYSAFPPALASRYDVIEIRRVWSFDTTLRIMDEM